VRLLKLADICDNFTRMIHRPENPQYLKNKILPIIEPMHQAIIKTKFKKYHKSSKQLIELSNLLLKNVYEIL